MKALNVLIIIFFLIHWTNGRRFRKEILEVKDGGSKDSFELSFHSNQLKIIGEILLSKVVSEIDGIWIDPYTTYFYGINITINDYNFFINSNMESKEIEVKIEEGGNEVTWVIKKLEGAGRASINCQTGIIDNNFGADIYLKDSGNSMSISTKFESKEGKITYEISNISYILEGIGVTQEIELPFNISRDIEDSLSKLLADKLPSELSLLIREYTREITDPILSSLPCPYIQTYNSLQISTEFTSPVGDPPYITFPLQSRISNGDKWLNITYKGGEFPSPDNLGLNGGIFTGNDYLVGGWIEGLTKLGALNIYKTESADTRVGRVEWTCKIKEKTITKDNLDISLNLRGYCRVSPIRTFRDIEWKDVNYNVILQLNGTGHNITECNLGYGFKIVFMEIKYPRCGDSGYDQEICSIEGSMGAQLKEHAQTDIGNFLRRLVFPLPLPKGVRCQVLDWGSLSHGAQYIQFWLST